MTFRSLDLGCILTDDCDIRGCIDNAKLNRTQGGSLAEQLGARIRRLRRALDLTQPELATRAKVSQSRVSRMEDEKSEPKASELQRLAAALHTNMRYLLTGEGPDGPTEAGEGLSYRSGVLSAALRMRMTLEEIEATSTDEAADAMDVAEQATPEDPQPRPEAPPGPPAAREG
jgi:transcriptional regulator with XRE-family HTH domain